MATNGFKLEEYVDCIDIFSIVDLSNYPGLNDATYNRLMKLNISGLAGTKKENFGSMKDVYYKANVGKSNICKHCIYADELKIVQDRIYPCCVVFGLALLNNINTEEAGVVIDRDWRKKLAKIDLERFCKICWFEASIKSFLVKK